MHRGHSLIHKLSKLLNLNQEMQSFCAWDILSNLTSLVTSAFSGRMCLLALFQQTLECRQGCGGAED